MDKTIKIENESAVNFLESLAYEVNARKDLLAYMLQNGTKPEDENFQAYHKEYQEFFVQYEAAKANFEKEYVRPHGESLAWSLDYATRGLTLKGLPA